MATFRWSVHQVTEYFTALSGHDGETGAVQAAVERAAEALDAECVVVVRHGQAIGQVGLGKGVAVPPALLAGGGTGTVELAGVGLCHTVSTQRRPGDPAEVLVAARLVDPFNGEERQLLQGMAQILALVLRGLRVLATERELREEKEREAEERLRLLAVVQARERLLQELLTIQRAISRRQPVAEVLTAITAAAVSLFDRDVVVAVAHQPSTGAQGLVLATSTLLEPLTDATVLRAAAEAIRTGATAGVDVVDGRVLALPVHVGEVVEASLIAVTCGAQVQPVERDVLAALCQQVSSALADARTLHQVQQAQHDDLTGLPGRALFLSRLTSALVTRAAQPRLTLLFIDLDRFKQVNDSLGHAAGDELLIAVAARLQQCLRGTDFAARLGGDEFAVLLHGLSPAASHGVADRITCSLKAPFRVAGREVFIASSIGIVEPDTDQIDAAALLSSADVAMYRCKKAGNGRPVLFDPAMHRQALDHLDLQGDLQRALAAGQLHLAHQPLIRLRDGRTTGVEALLRWDHPTRGPVPPSTFIPLAEETGLIVDLGRWVLQEATRQLARWRRDFPDLTINVNVSGKQLDDPAFPADVLEALAHAGLPPHALTLELTETVLMSDPEHAPERLGRLRDLGLRLAVDDFGTGYSSLSYLRRLPVHELKIDKAFIDGLGRDPADAAITGTIIELGHTLGLRTVAEGIETQPQLTALRDLGCELGQGFHLARPLRGTSVDAHLRAHLPGAGTRPGSAAPGADLRSAPRQPTRRSESPSRGAGSRTV